MLPRSPSASHEATHGVHRADGADVRLDHLLSLASAKSLHLMFTIWSLPLI